MTSYIDHLIMLCVGLWASAVGFGYIPPPGQDAAGREQFMRRFGRMFRVTGPILVVIATVLAVSSHGLRPGS